MLLLSSSVSAPCSSDLPAEAFPVEEAEEAASAARAQAAPSTAEVEYPSTDSEALAVAQQARQLAARAVNAATQSLAGLHELETTDYPAIYGE